MYAGSRPLPLLDRSLWIPAMAVGMRLASSGTANASYLLLAGYALLGRAQAVQALALVWLFNMLGWGVAPTATSASIGRYAVLFAAAASVFVRSGVLESGGRLNPATGWTIALGIFFVVHSILFSPIPDVSILKSVSWTLAMATLISAWSGLAVPERTQLARRLFIGMLLVMMVSMPLLVSPIGYLLNGTGFQGVMGHPQAFGAFAALLGAWAAGLVLDYRKPPWSLVALVGIALALIVASETRTGGFAMVLGVSFAVATVRTLSGLPIRVMMPGLFSRRFQVVVLLAGVGSIIAAPILQGIVADFLDKRRGQTQSIFEAYEDSRGGLMDRMWKNIEENPLVGIGFGLDSEVESMEIARDPILGLPIGATIEKGVLPIAVLEEVGLIGFLAFSAWIWMLVRRCARAGIAPLAVALTALLLNMGEAALLSPGGVGLLSLVLISWALASPRLSGRGR